MIEYYTPLLTSIKTMLGYKSTSFLGASIFTALSLEAFTAMLSVSFLGVSIGLLLMIGLFILIDWFTGSSASNKKAKEFKDKLEKAECKDEDCTKKLKADYELYRIKSSKITFTIFKFISLYLWLLLSNGVTSAAINNGFIEGAPMQEVASIGLGSVLRIFTIVPIILFGFREFISIGENINNLYGKTPYLFTLGEKMFDTLQFKFLKKLKDD